ncbi:MAG: hypothetical protein KHX56_00400 [Clostridiales bacterium]|nr:hypothetical protein [Clostridiales bacterium]
MSKKIVLRIILFLTAAAFLTAGIVQGDFHTTWTKAIRICLECIGIG